MHEYPLLHYISVLPFLSPSHANAAVAALARTGFHDERFRVSHLKSAVSLLPLQFPMIPVFQLTRLTTRSEATRGLPGMTISVS